MVMLFTTFATFVACMALTTARENKFTKTMPNIFDSLVNNGKMEVSFYFNDVPQMKREFRESSQPFSAPHAPPSCSCAGIKSGMSPFMSEPSGVLSKILKSNNFFKDFTSTACCDSREHGQENTVLFEITPNDSPMESPRKSMFPFPSFPIQRAINKPGSRAVEILLFPKRKDMASPDFTKFAQTWPKKTIPKSEIKIVGDHVDSREQEKTSVKKDLTLLENRTTKEKSPKNIESMITSSNLL